jgi:hypothetical protein
MLKLFVRALTLATFAAGIAGAPAAAQPAAVALQPAEVEAQIRPDATGRPAVHLPCCQCVDGRRIRVRLNTRAAPWFVRSPGSAAFLPVAAAGHPAWTTALGPAGWVGPQGAGQAPGNYIYELRVVMPRCLIRPVVRVAGRFAADNSATTTIGSTTSSTPGFGNAGIRPFGGTLAIAPGGTATIRITVRNNEGPTGLIALGYIEIVCPRQRADGTMELEAAIDRSEIEAQELNRAE